VAPWFFTKAVRPVVAYQRANGHRIFSYLDDFFEAGATARNDHPATAADTEREEMDIRSLFARLGLDLHQKKCHFVRSQSLEILGIMVDTRCAQFLLFPAKTGQVESAAMRLLAHARAHRRHVSARALRSFVGLLNSTGLTVGDALLRLSELFDALALEGRPEEMSELGASSEERSDGAPSGNSDIIFQPARVSTPPEAPPEAAPQAKSFLHTPCRAPSARQPCISHAGKRDLRCQPQYQSTNGAGGLAGKSALMFTDESMRGGAIGTGRYP
jgi:hypothetical protein